MSDYETDHGHLYPGELELILAEEQGTEGILSPEMADVVKDLYRERRTSPENRANTLPGEHSEN